MSTLTLDPLYAKAEHLGEVIGHFCSTPIRTLNQRAVDLDQLLEVQHIVDLGMAPAPAEILPGERTCEDGIIRRVTSAEAVGPEFYNFAIPKDMRKVGITEARQASLAGEMVWFRPDGRVGEGEFALLQQEEAQ
jgi:hypothetical protein